MLRLNKHEASSRLREALNDVPAFILLDYTGITVSEATALRNKFREGECKYQVFKNSVVHYAVKGTRHEPVSRLLTGMTALAYSPTDPGAAARIAREFAREAKNLKIKGGIVEGTVLDPPASISWPTCRAARAQGAVPGAAQHPGHQLRPRAQRRAAEPPLPPQRPQRSARCLS